MASSADKFRALTKQLQQSIAATTIAELNNQADGLIEFIRSVVPTNTGALRNSIRKEPGKNVLQVKVVAGDKTAFYARWVEFGTAPHSVAKGADLSRGKRQRGVQQGGSKAHPFFWPTYRLRKKVMRAAVRKAIYAEIKKVSA